MLSRWQSQSIPNVTKQCEGRGTTNWRTNVLPQKPDKHPFQFLAPRTTSLSPLPPAINYSGAHEFIWCTLFLVQACRSRTENMWTTVGTCTYRSYYHFPPLLRRQWYCTGYSTGKSAPGTQHSSSWWVYSIASHLCTVIGDTTVVLVLSTVGNVQTWMGRRYSTVERSTQVLEY